MQRYKVFFNDRTLFFTARPDNELVINSDAIYKFDTSNGLKRFTEDFLSKEHLQAAVIYGHSPKEIFKEFRSFFRNIQAAGGMVFNDKKEFIGIYRRSKNDLPKGKLEKGETIEEGAVREVKEECGISNVEILNRITETYHIYFIDETPVLKRTHWFRMYTNDNELTPQTEEDISEIFWVSLSNIKEFMTNTYPSIEEVIIASGILNN